MKEKKVVLPISEDCDKAPETHPDWSGLEFLAEVCTVVWEKLERKRRLQRCFLEAQATGERNSPAINPPSTSGKEEDDGEIKYSWVSRRKRSLWKPAAALKAGVVPDLSWRPSSSRVAGAKRGRSSEADDESSSGDNNNGEQALPVARYNKDNKKNKHQGPSPPPLPSMPAELRNRIVELAGPGADVSDEKLLIQKVLTMSDVKDNQNRLSIPTNHMIHADFLTVDEERLLCRHIEKNVGSLGVTVIEPSLEKGTASLRRWEYHKSSGRSTVSYVITETWKLMAKRNGLKEGMSVQVWSVRVSGKLWLAIERLP